MIESIENHPERHAPKLPPYRRAMMKKFPYAIYFYVDEPQNEILVFAVWHVKRNLNSLLKRLELI